MMIMPKSNKKISKILIN